MGVLTADFALVACCSTKRNAPAAAFNLYCSDLFLKSRAYVESLGLPWYVISAKHGLLKTDAIVAPYDLRIDDLTPTERERWARRVSTSIRLDRPPPGRVIILAGVPYRRFLTPLLVELGYSVEAPLEGLAIGIQKQWLKDAVS